MKIEYGNISFSFENPPAVDEIEQIKPLESVFESITGERQVVNHGMVKLLPQSFTMMSRGFVDTNLLPFFRDHALLGLPFKYFLDPNSLEFETYRLEDRVYEVAKNESTIDRYDISFVLRRL